MNFQKMKFLRAVLPNISSGAYQVEAYLDVQEPEKETFPIEKVTVYSSCPKFTLPESIIHHSYPPNGATGCFENTLPHIVFSRKDYPWAHQWRGKLQPTPWHCFLCLTEEEAPEIQQTTIGELLSENPEDVFVPAWKYEKSTGESVNDLCSYIDLDQATFQKVVPQESELEYLSHARVIDMYDKQDDLTGTDGYFSATIGNRFPLSSTSGSKNHVYLVSLLGYEDFLPAGSCSIKQSKVRLVVLHHWAFVSTSAGWSGFRVLMENLDCAPLSTAPVETPTSQSQYLLASGYIPLRHITRTGEETFSLYRGPLAPFQVPLRTHRECHTADGEIVYDPKLGLMDMSYASAWQLGRLSALEQQDIAKAIYQWRRSLKKQAIKSMERKQLAGILSTDSHANAQQQNDMVPQMLLHITDILTRKGPYSMGDPVRIAHLVLSKTKQNEE